LEEVGQTSYEKFLANLLRKADKDKAQEPNVLENFNNITLVQVKLHECSNQLLPREQEELCATSIEVLQLQVNKW